MQFFFLIDYTGHNAQGNKKSATFNLTGALCKFIGKNARSKSSSGQPLAITRLAFFALRALVSRLSLKTR